MTKRALIALIFLALPAADAAAGGRVVTARTAKERKVITTRPGETVTLRAPAGERVTKQGQTLLGVTRVKRVQGVKTADGKGVEFELGPGRYNLTKRSYLGGLIRKVEEIEVVATPRPPSAGGVVRVRSAVQQKILAVRPGTKATIRAPRGERITRDGPTFLGFVRTRPIKGAESRDGRHVEFELGPGVYNLTKRSYLGGLLRKVTQVRVVEGDD